MTNSTSEQDFVKLIRENERIIYKVCSLYVSDTYTLADLYQEVVCNLWRGLPKFRNDSSPGTWIYRVALNTCISGMRKAKRHPKSDYPVEELSDWLIEQDNSLNETIIVKMVQGKAEKSINRLLGLEIIGTIIVFLIIPFIAFSIEKNQDKMLFFWNVLIITSGILCTLSIIWGICKIYTLSKIDFSKEISATIYHFNKYRILVKREYCVLIYIFMPVLFTLAVLSYAEENVTFSLWMFLVCMFLLLILIVWYSIKNYKKTHAAIVASLNEIKELKEE